MFDQNHFKKTVKNWMQENPAASVDDIIDFCEEIIPPSDYTANEWLISQTAQWYKHILVHRQSIENYDGKED